MLRQRLCLHLLFEILSKTRNAFLNTVFFGSSNTMFRRLFQPSLDKPTQTRA